MYRSLVAVAKSLVASSAIMLLPAVASANGSSVSPTRLLLATGAASTYVTITNTSPVPQRYSASAYHWSETPTTAVVLAPTADIVFFPGSFTLDSLHSQRIRIGSAAASDVTEKTYRIVVSELPPLQNVLTPQAAGLAFTLHPFHTRDALIDTVRRFVAESTDPRAPRVDRVSCS